MDIEIIKNKRGLTVTLDTSNLSINGDVAKGRIKFDLLHENALLLAINLIKESDVDYIIKSDEIRKRMEESIIDAIRSADFSSKK